MQGVAPLPFSMTCILFLVRNFVLIQIYYAKTRSNAAVKTSFVSEPGEREEGWMGSEG